MFLIQVIVYIVAVRRYRIAGMFISGKFWRIVYALPNFNQPNFRHSYGQNLLLFSITVSLLGHRSAICTIKGLKIFLNLYMFQFILQCKHLC